AVAAADPAEPDPADERERDGGEEQSPVGARHGEPQQGAGNRPRDGEREKEHRRVGDDEKRGHQAIIPTSGNARAGSQELFRNPELRSGEVTRPPRAEQSRLDRRRRLSRRRVRRRIGLGILAALLVPVVYSYVTTLTKPSSLPLSVRSIEWVRANHGAWLVNTVEHYWYSWTAPAPGGPSLKVLPSVGVSTRTRRAKPRKHVVPAYRPPRVMPVLRPALPGEGVWQATGQTVGGLPPVLVTTYRPDPTYPRVVAYVAWIDHTRTQTALYPGRYEPPGASPRGPMEIPPGQRSRLLATFNSGFTYNDGHGGFAVDGQTVKPLQDGEGTVVAYRDGRVDVITWHGGQNLPRWLVFARQNLPLIVDAGRPSPQ